jgi:hypothetical protein
MSVTDECQFPAPLVVIENNDWMQDLWLHYKYINHYNYIQVINMEEWDQASNDFILRCNSCWRTNAQTKIIRTSREKYYCLDCLAHLTYAMDRSIIKQYEQRHCHLSNSIIVEIPLSCLNPDGVSSRIRSSQRSS